MQDLQISQVMSISILFLFPRLCLETLIWLKWNKEQRKVEASCQVMKSCLDTGRVNVFGADEQGLNPAFVQWINWGRAKQDGPLKPESKQDWSYLHNEILSS